MKTYLECIRQAALDMKATDHYNSYYAIINYIAPILNRAADMYAEQSKSHIPVVVRGGAIEAQSVPLEGEALKWTNSSVTQITPTEPLPAEGQAQNGRDGVMKWCDSCGKITYWIDGECENYKERGGSAKGVLPF